ncbi:MAG TPA: LysR family transcriptional regulator [Xanthomonadales bacterium]|nr:LysR family transcriptional regulator [Xanthomonadales bacterium]
MRLNLNSSPPASKAARRRSAPPKQTPAPRFYYKGNRLKQLRAFCSVAKLGSVAAGAESLFLSASSVSLQLSALQKELGTALVERVGRRVQLTREGLMLYELARPVLEGLDALDREFRAKLGGGAVRELNIAAGSSTIQYLLPPLVQQYRARFPDTRLQLHNVSNRDGLALVRSDEVDFAFGSVVEVPGDLAYEAVHHFDPVLIMPPDHPLAAKPDAALELADLSAYGLILPPNRVSTFRLVDLVFQQRKVPYQVAIEVGGWEVIKQYVAMGLGISIVSGMCIEPGDRLAVRNARRWFPQRSYGVVVRKGKLLSPEARAFVDLIKPGLFSRRDHEDSGHSER